MYIVHHFMPNHGIKSRLTVDGNSNAFGKDIIISANKGRHTAKLVELAVVVSDP